MKREDAIDFHEVRQIHNAIHDRLENWARYVCAGNGGKSCAPMFRHYRSSEVWQEPTIRTPIDSLDGSKIERMVGQLPEQHMMAVRWWYVYSNWGVSMHKACRVMGIGRARLNDLVHDGRTMLKNRSV